MTDRNSRRIADLVKLSGNSECADCGYQRKDPMIECDLVWLFSVEESETERERGLSLNPISVLSKVSRVHDQKGSAYICILFLYCWSCLIECDRSVAFRC